MTLNRNYSRPVINDSGYVLLYPNIGDDGELLQAEPPNPYAQSVYQEFPLGTKLFQGEKGWWYNKNSAAQLGIAIPSQGAAAIHAEADDDIVVGAASAIGATTVTLTSTTNLATAPLSTKDGFAEGELIVNDGPGEGQIYKIKGHEAASSTDDFEVTLYDPLTIALTTSSEVGLVQHPCANVLASKAVMTNIFTGIPLLVVTASYYFWGQMEGPCAVDANAAIALGTEVVIGTTAASADPAAAATTEITIGSPMTPGITNGEKFIVMLKGNW